LPPFLPPTRSKEAREAEEREVAAILAESAAKSEAEQREMTSLPARFTGFFGTSAALVALLAAAFFADRWHMRAQADLVVLGGVGLAVFLALRDAYERQAEAAIERARERLTSRLAAAGAQSTADQRRACAEEGGFYALFVVNFWFLAIFGALAVGVLPWALGTTAELAAAASAAPGEPIVASWYHVVGSCLPAAALVVLSARRLI
jgi:hypothetical protein